MKNYALINATGVVENVVLWDGNSEWTPPDGYSVVQSDDAAIGWSYADGVFTPPVAASLPIEDVQQQVLTRINAHAARLLATLSASYPDGEVQSWGQQTREAESLAIDPNAAAPLLTAIAAARGITTAELATRVRDKEEAYTVASGKIIGQRQALVDALMAIDLQAPNAAEQIAAITWPDE